MISSELDGVADIAASFGVARSLSAYTTSRGAAR